jgi:hypothetical protein
MILGLRAGLAAWDVTKPSKEHSKRSNLFMVIFIFLSLTESKLRVGKEESILGEKSTGKCLIL